MRIPISWLNEYVDVSDLSVQELSDKLTFSGVEVEAIETDGPALDDHFVVGEVLTCDPHPDSDHMHVCTVDVGTEKLGIVCGALGAKLFPSLGAKLALSPLLAPESAPSAAGAEPAAPVAAPAISFISA